MTAWTSARLSDASSVVPYEQRRLIVTSLARFYLMINEPRNLCDDDWIKEVLALHPSLFVSGNHELVCAVTWGN
jgi:hypothetical protein